MVEEENQAQNEEACEMVESWLIDVGIISTIVALALLAIGVLGWVMIPDDASLRVFAYALVGSLVFGAPGIYIIVLLWSRWY